MDSHKPASLFRKIAAGIYDIFIIFALLLLATSLALLINQGQSLKPYSFLFTFYLILIIGFFYCWFWTHGGQTIGMQAWKIKVVDQNLNALSWPQAIKRFIFALPCVGFFGLGFLSCLFFNKNKLSVHDFASSTRVIS